MDKRAGAGFTHLSLTDLRSVRNALDDEEVRVSYWRRLIQARIDVTRAGGRHGIADIAALQHVLSEHHATSVRPSLLRAMPDDACPPLPDIAALWSRLDVGNDAGGRVLLLNDLVAVECRLSSYRRVLHERIDAATAELVRRYRAKPLLCLVALPGADGASHHWTHASRL